MKKKLRVFAMALGLSVAALTGCSKPTVESLVDGMYDNEIDSQTAEVDMDIVLSFSTQGMTIELSLDGDFEVQSSTDDGDQMFYMDGELSMDMAGESERVGFEMYALLEDDGYGTTYLYNEDKDTWYKSEGDIDDSVSLDQDMVDEVMENMKNVLKENGELAEDTEDFEGEECYVITATMEGDDLADIYEPFGDFIDDSVKDAGADIDIDFLSWIEYFTIDITYYISKDTGYAVGTEIDMADSDVLGMVNQFISDFELDGFMMDMFEKMSFSECKFTCVVSDINDTEVKIPRDVINNAVSSDDRDGKYGYEDTVYYTLNKCDASNEKLVDVCVGGPWSYDDKYSANEKDMYLDHEDGGFIYISNEAYEPLYSYASAWVQGESVDSSTRLTLERNGYMNCDYDFEVIGSAFDGNDLILAEEAYTYVENGDYEMDMECTYLLIRYSDDGYIEFLTVDFYDMDTDGWTDEEYEELARNLFGK